MNKFKAGQKVKVVRTGKIGKIKEVDSDDFTTFGGSIICYKVEYNDSTGINWFTVHDLELVKEILDKKEKEYLGNVIKPFRNRVIYIEKGKWQDREYINIYIKNEDTMIIPSFYKGTRYKGMESNKKYTLQELRLED